MSLSNAKMGYRVEQVEMRMPRWLKFLRFCTPRTLRKVIVASNRRRLTGLAAEMAYNAMLALFPTMLAVLTAIGLFKPLKATFQGLAEQVSEVVPTDAFGLIQGIAGQISASRNEQLFSFSFIFALWAASGALSTAMAAMDQIQQMPRKVRRPFWKARLVALLLTGGALVFLIVSGLLIFVSDAMIRTLVENGWVSVQLLRLWQLLSLPLALGMMAVMFAVIYRFGPSRWQSGQPIMPGAVLAAISWAILSNVLRLGVRYIGTNQIYGVVGAVIVLLLWLYMSSLVLLIGAQINVTVGDRMQQGRSITQG